MNTKNNQRSRITKLLFQNNLIDLLIEGKTIDSITITDICKRAELNRGTFYAHYQVPKDILDELEAETFQSFTNYLAELNKNNDIDRLTDLLKYIRENKKIYQILFVQQKNTEFTKKIVNSVLLELSDLDNYIKDLQMKPYLYSFLIHGSESMIIHWINSNFDIDESTLSRAIYSTCKKAIETYSLN